MSEAKNLQKWALELSGAGKYLKTLPVKKKKDSLYVNYDIDENELEDDGLDYCTPEVASVWAVDLNGEETKLAGVRAYNWETY